MTTDGETLGINWGLTLFHALCSGKVGIFCHDVLMIYFSIGVLAGDFLRR